MPHPPQLAPPPPPTAAERVGQLLRRERNATRLSQQTLAERLGIHQATLARWELGRSAPTLAQVDEVLGYLGLRLRLDLEPIPDPRNRWDQEALRLASLTPAQRLRETGHGLADLMKQAQRLGVAGVVDGQTAAWLQGIPGPPRWMEIATTPDQVYDWVTLRWVSQGAVDSTRERLRLTKAEATEDFIRDRQGHVMTVYGFIRLRVVDVLPETVLLCLRDADDEGEAVVTEVIRLDALAAHWQQPTP